MADPSSPQEGVTPQDVRPRAPSQTPPQSQHIQQGGGLTRSLGDPLAAWVPNPRAHSREMQRNKEDRQGPMGLQQERGPMGDCRGASE